MTADAPVNQNSASPTDANDDGSTSSLDALVIINHLNRNAAGGTGFYDVNGDGTVSAADALMVINRLQPEKTTVEAEQADDNGVDPISEDERDEQEDLEDSVDDDESPADDGDADYPGNDSTDHRHHHRFGGRPLLRDLGQRLLIHFDGDENGSISKDEVPERLWQKLVDKNIDVDGNGSISQEEFEDYAAQRRAERFARKDFDDSGSLTEDEVRPRFWNQIAEADTNQDGGVTLAELEAWLAEQHSDAPESDNEEEASAEGEQLDESGSDDDDVTEGGLDEDELDELECPDQQMDDDESESNNLRFMVRHSDRLFAQLARNTTRP